MLHAPLFMKTVNITLVGEGINRQKVWPMGMARTDQPFPDVKLPAVTWKI
jgi:hypothetical protein